MTQSGSDFLLRLSALAVAFVGWSAIVVTLRRALSDEKLGKLHTYFVRFFIEGGLTVAAFGLLPAMLLLTNLADHTVWRIASAAAAVTFSAYIALLFRRRRRITRDRLPPRSIVSFATSSTATLALWANTSGLGWEPGAAAYAFALSALLAVGGWTFVWNLDIFLDV